MDGSTSGRYLAAAGLFATLPSVFASQISIQIPSLGSNNQTSMLASWTRNGGEGSTMAQWSSLIGIVTALIGNVLISVALNIQRFAHIQIGREWEHEKLLKESHFRRANADRFEHMSYGSTDSVGDNRGRRSEEGSTWVPYRDESRGSSDVASIYHDSFTDDSLDGRGNQGRRSFQSDRTLRPTGQDLQMGGRKSYLRSPYWWAGIVLMTLGETGNFLAYGFAPASIVSPLGVVALISNCVIAPFMLKERFRKQDLWGVIVAIAGAVVVVLSAKSSEEKIGPGEIWAMITRWEFELYLGLSAGLIIALMWASDKYGSRTILIDVGLVALFGGFTALSTKGVSSLLSYTLWHAITFPITYLLVFVLAFSALMQIRYINRALQRFDSTQVIPTQFVMFTLSVIIGSAVLYRDFESTSPSRAVKFVGGCVLTFVGVYFITSGRGRRDDDSAFSIIEDDEEEAIGLLAGEHFRSSSDVTRGNEHPKPHGDVHEPRQKFNEPHDDTLHSSGASLLSVGSDDIDQQPTPRGVLSPSPSSAAGSLDGPISTWTPERSSPEQSHSSDENPWKEHQPSKTHSAPELSAGQPVTPTDESQPAPTESTVLLRFPAAPGIEDSLIQGESAGGQQKPTGTEIDHRRPHHDHEARSRSTLPVGFPSGRFLPTISTGFSAVVAESLRRGEITPVLRREHTHSHTHTHGRRKRSSGPIHTDDKTNANGTIEATSGPDDNPNSNPNSNNDHDHQHLIRPSTQQTTTQTQTTVETPESDSRDSRPDTEPNNTTTPRRDSNVVTTRLRSLSDAWLGGSLGKGNGNDSQQRRSISTADNVGDANVSSTHTSTSTNDSDHREHGPEESEHEPEQGEQIQAQAHSSV